MRDFLSSIDHLVYTVDDLQQGLEYMEGLFGVAPALGGHHPDFGTYNALLGLGPESYLEIIAIDKSLPRPGQGWPFGLSEYQVSGFQTWAIKSDLSDSSLIPSIFGTILKGSRRTNSGKLLSWKLTDPWLMPLDGVIPFLIDWGETEHPAVDLPQAGILEDIHVKHPGATEVQSTLQVLDLDSNFVQYGDRVEMKALIRLGNGKLVSLQK